MEHGQESSDSAVLRRRRRIGRPTREKTPEPTIALRQKYSDEYSESSTYEPIQFVQMQIRPPGAMSAHESKILRRRDKTFASAAARSHSQPRQAERLSSPEANELIRTVGKRSLSSPRHKEESSEGEHFITTPEILEKYPVFPTKEDDNLTRLEQNLRRFEDERRRFELEKKIFEREKREHKVRYKQHMDNGERKRLVDNYRKLSERISLTSDPEDRRRMVQSLRISRNEAPTRLKPVKPSGYESSTQLSSSESEAVHYEDHDNYRSKPPTHNPVQKHTERRLEAIDHPPPPPVPVRRSVSRNNSLSPIRPARRSKTPDTGSARNSSIEDNERTNSKAASRDHQSSLENSAPRVVERKRSFREPEDTSKYPTSLIEEAVMQTLERKRSLNGYEEPSLKSSVSDATIPNLERKKSLRDVEVNHKTETETEVDTMKLLRKQNLKSSLKSREEAVKVVPKDIADRPAGLSIISKLITYLKRPKVASDDSVLPSESLLTKAFIKEMFSDFRTVWVQLKADHPLELDAMRKVRNKCFAHMIILVLLCGFGGLMFRYTEGSFENIYKCEVRKVKRDFIDYLWTVSHNMREDDWKSAARMRLRKFEEELHTMQELGVRRFPGMKSWNFVNCVLYCWTVITTIGYGHITPQTTLGRTLTVAYALIGIPLFLIILADFGKLFTRAIKFLWAYVRRLYYTGTCRKFRKQQQVVGVLSGINNVYDYTIRRPSNYIYGDESYNTPIATVPEESNVPPAFVVDDEFNLPISLAIVILISYILFGAFTYTLWEDWSYTEAFYFVFISMSTIGFGDFVPNHPIFMMFSITYMIFGLSLTSMFINVVQIKLSDTFKRASAKIGSTIGLSTAEANLPKLDGIGKEVSGEMSDVVDSEEGSPPIPPKRTVLGSLKEAPKKKK